MMEGVMVRIRRFGVVKTATVAAVLYFVVTLIFVALFALIVLAAGSSSFSAPGAQVAPGLSAGAGAGAILIGGVIIAVIYAIVGWIFTAIACALYNLVAGFTGGIEVELQAVAPPPAVPTWGPSTTPPAPPSQQG
jgi:hypothetical protein